MIVYSSNKQRFLQDVQTNRIHQIILDEFRRRLSKTVGDNEITSWRNSLQHMANALRGSGVPEGAGVSIEYHVPLTSKRVDFILSGRDEQGKDTAVIVELKQWSTVKLTAKDAVVLTFIGGRELEVSHPSYQAWAYASLIEDYNETVRMDEISLVPCAYLHNMDEGTAINDPFYKEHLDNAPVFISRDAERFADFLSRFVKFPDDRNIMYRIDHGRIKPSKNLVDHLDSLLRGNREFLMIDDQKIVYEAALELLYKAQKKKQVLIVEGGPGTGKSVVAINLLVEITRRSKTVHYVSKNAAPRAVYQSTLTGTPRRGRINFLFKGSGSYVDTPENSLDTLIVDEAHRLNAKSGLYGNLGENQIKEIISASRLSIFFVDEAQRVTLKDIGATNEIQSWADKLDAQTTVLQLQSQFRCNGSDGFIAFVESSLQLRETANPDPSGLEYDFRVFDSPVQLKELIVDLNVPRNKARMVAGYCWDWKSKRDSTANDIELPEHGFASQWNLNDDGSLWIMAQHSVNQIGCIHTCQGLEVDYIGVIIGPDLIVRNGRVLTDAGKRSRMDSSVRGHKKLSKSCPEEAKKQADAIIKNTYRTLMTRGQKGCFIFCTDPETNEYFKSLAKQSNSVPPSKEEKYPGLNLQIFDSAQATRRHNLVPLYDLKVAAGDFSDYQSLAEHDWVELPDYLRAKPDFFVTRVMGESMNRKIPNGAWCLFKQDRGGSREGKIVLVQHQDIQDHDTGGKFTVKRYHSEKVESPEGEWQHAKIVLKPESTVRGFKDLELIGASIDRLTVLGELVTVLT